MTWDGICEHGLLLDTYCEECDKPPMTDLREAIARRIAARKTGVACRTGIGLPDDIWRQALPDADDALAAIEAAGWQCVPKEPTEEMYAAASWGSRPNPHSPFIWRTMLAAAPKPGGER